MRSEPRSWLFVPADSEKKIGRALESQADALILDLEDSVSLARKSDARDILRALRGTGDGPQRWVRINPLSSPESRHDIELVIDAGFFGIVLPKSETGEDVEDLTERSGNIPIHAIVTETPASLFGLLSYRNCSPSLRAMSWGAEDLSAAIGASSKFDGDGDLAFTYRLARSLCLAGAAAAEVQAVDGVFTDFRDLVGLRTEAEGAAREGFTGKLAIHPDQVEVINAAFTPTDSEVAHARAVIAAFDAQADAGVVAVDGRMVDRPHLIQARRTVERAGG